MESQGMDLRTAEQCARAYSEATGLGCTLSDHTGKVLCEYGCGCARCPLCALAGIDRKRAEEAHLYGMSEAARFGGKYIYFCPLGLTCFVSPVIFGATAARMTVGPFLMVSREDFVECDLDDKAHLDGENRRRVIEALEEVPFVEPKRVRALADLLFFSVRVLSDPSQSEIMLDRQAEEELQERMSGYISALKGAGQPQKYPVVTEKRLISAIAAGDREEASRMLNELLGYVFFSTGGNFERIKTRAYEMLVMISRAAMDGGGDVSRILEMNERYFQEIQSIDTLETLCFWLTTVMDAYLENLFFNAEIRHYDVIHKALAYLRAHLTEKISLEEVASRVYLTPSYLSRLFKREVGTNFSIYINRLRVERSIPLLLQENARLADVAQAVGFEDQSYFTKVFRRVTGMTPSRYRISKGRGVPATQELHSQEDNILPEPEK